MAPIAPICVFRVGTYDVKSGLALGILICRSESVVNQSLHGICLATFGSGWLGAEWKTATERQPHASSSACSSFGDFNALAGPIVFRLCHSRL